VLVAYAFSLLAVAALCASSVAAGVLFIGRQPLIDLSGVLMSPGQALGRTLLAWVTMVPPLCAFTSLAVLTSVLTRNSAAGVALPIVAGLAMQLCAFIDGPETFRWILLTSSFGAWHGLVIEHPHYRPLAYAIAVSALYVLVSLAIAYVTLQRRDIGG
jgi:ABC-2 type transport system permease protein